jgi:hypothetical protein
MNKKLSASVALILLCGSTVASSEVKEIILDDFKNGLSDRWKMKSFLGETEYRVDSESHFITADSKGTASGLYYEIEYSPEEYPVLSWTWKIDKTLEKGDARTKAGDDYAARVYVIFPSFLFWKTKALNYVWANKLKKEQFIPNAYTSNAMMIAVESGSANVGAWVAERRNIVEDYQKAFGNLPPRVGSIAIMTDTDNTKEAVKAYYGPIKILSD